LGFVFPYSALADRDRTPPIEILAAYVDFDNDTITLYGINFDNGTEPVVTLGLLGEADLDSYTGSQIILDFSSGGLPADGDYRVVVTTGRGNDRTDTYDLTIGAAQGDGGLDVATVQSCTTVPSGTWVPTQSKSANATCSSSRFPIAGGCRIVNVVSWTYSRAFQTKDNPSGSDWVCEWAMPAALLDGTTVLGETELCAWAICAE